MFKIAHPFGSWEKRGRKCTCLQRHDLTFLSTSDWVWKYLQFEVLQVNSRKAIRAWYPWTLVSQINTYWKKKTKICHLKQDNKSIIGEVGLAISAFSYQNWGSENTGWAIVNRAIQSVCLTVVLVFPEGTLKNSVGWGCIICASKFMEKNAWSLRERYTDTSKTSGEKHVSKNSWQLHRWLYQMEICSLIDTSCYKPYEQRRDEVVTTHVWFLMEIWEFDAMSIPEEIFKIFSAFFVVVVVVGNN